MNDSPRELLIRRFPILELLKDPQDPALTDEMIEEIEIVLGLRFPQNYKDFLLAFNGGFFARDVGFTLPEPKPFLDGVRLLEMFGEPADGIDDYGLVKRIEVLNDRIPEDCLPIAYCNFQDYVVLRFAEDRRDFAGVWFWNSEALWDEEEQMLHWLADTFNDFLSMLEYDVTAYEGPPEKLSLFQTVQNGSFSLIQKYLNEGGKVEARNAKGQTLLMASILYSWPRITKLLLDRAADPNARDKKGKTPLHHAACHSVDCVKLLLAAGADAKARDNKGKSVLAEWSYRADQILRAHGAEE